MALHWSADLSWLPKQAVGVLSSAYTSGWLVGKVGARPVLALMALFPLLMCFTACLIQDRRQGYDELQGEEDAPQAAGGQQCFIISLGFWDPQLELGFRVWDTSLYSGDQWLPSARI